MREFGYERASDVSGAVALLDADPDARFLGGGTNLVDLMKTGVERPARLVDVRELPLDRIESTEDGGLRIGATVTNSDLAAHPEVRRRYPALTPGRAGRRLRAAAQHGHGRRQPPPAHPLRLLHRRHQALQQARPRQRLPRHRGRAPQPRDPRRLRALRGHPPLGHGRWRWPPSTPSCTYETADGPGELPLARVLSARGRHPAPGDRAAAGRADHRRHAAARARVAAHSRYRKVRERASYAFAIGSVAAALDVRDGARPRRAPGLRGGRVPAVAGPAAERVLTGGPATAEAFAAAADAELAAAEAAARTTPTR